MGEMDIYSGDYMSDEERCADAINVGCFHGKQVIRPEQIREINSVTNIVNDGKNGGKKQALQLRRDIVNVVTFDTNFCIIGIENQTDVNYIMPVRVMLYDVMQYKKQGNKIRSLHRKLKDIEGAEWLSGFAKKDKLKAVVTLVVYFGTEPWDGAKEMHELIDWTDIPEDFREIVPNYSIYLLELNKYENLDDFKSDLKAVSRFIQNSDDKQKLRTMLEEHADEFEGLPEDAYDLIEKLGNMGELKERKKACKREDGGYDMCKGMDDWIKSSMEEGAHDKLLEQVEKKLMRGKTAEEIADALEEDVETILLLIEELKVRKAV